MREAAMVEQTADQTSDPRQTADQAEPVVSRSPIVEDDHEARPTPPAVITAVAAGTGALPFLAVYATLFIVHGGFHPVIPPDVTTSNRGELIVGIACLLVFLVTLVSLFWLLGRSRRWPFVVMQAGLLGVAADFFTDDTKGGRFVSGLVFVTALVGLIAAVHPQTWDHMGRRCPRWLGRVFGRKS